MTINSTLRSIFGKTLAIAFFAAVMTVASYAQSGTLFEKNGARFGTITAFGSTWVINNLNGGGEIKIYRCSDMGNTGLLCSFTQFDNSGRSAYSGQSQIFQSGAVFLNYQNDVRDGQQRRIDSGWLAYQVR